ncbi:molybdopterin biosynthesis protein [Gordonibacter sp. 28C]|uniref:molybdopterin-binding protein n=1 Tax=Gordonibacter sp. 28C TaxID=2078569 RepID=UPI000DF79E4F|nr:molybdopterin-binding protein [Gordonibacter sp. 28C]RDB63317.1 molybdopterin biosynthesis protein [Gordonibacter sp. 28C]
MRDHSNHIQLTREQAVEQMLARLGDGFGWGDVAADGPQDAEGHRREIGRKLAETVPVADAVGRVLAYDVRAQCDVPSCLTCGMDSIAVHWRDFEGLEPGALPDTSAWVRGTDWEFANTGVAMPEGFDAAIVVEHVRVSDDERRVAVDAAPSRRFAGTRPAGGQMKRLDVIAEAGSLVTPDLAARIASGNNAVVPVVRKPRVAFIPTGNELVPPGVPFNPDKPEAFAARGKNFETNSILVRAKVEAWGGEFVPFGIVRDARDAIRQAIERACEVADIVVLNAGSSKGSDDWSCEVMEELGDIICHQTNHGPGHHSSYALVDGVPIVGISGPSGGASFTLNFYLRPLMRTFLGLEPEVPRIPARLAAPFPQGGPGSAPKPEPGEPLPGEARPLEHPPARAASAGPGEPEFFGVKMLSLSVGADGVLEAAPLAGRPGSVEAQAANAYYLLPSGPGIEPPAVGDVIEVELR